MNNTARTLTIIFTLITFVILLPASPCQAICTKTEPLFTIERSKNGNTVHYDICIGNRGYPSDTEPVIAYWILENGKREDLSKLDRELAYGIAEYKKVGKTTVRIILASMKKRAIIIRKIGDRYRATMPIDGKESILERVYIKSDERPVGLPSVRLISLYGRTRDKGLPLSERIEKP